MTEKLPQEVHISTEVLFQKLGEECVLLDLKNDNYYGCDDVASRMWELIAEYKSPDKVIEKMLEEYNIDEETLRHDLGKLIEQWVAEGVVSVKAANE